MRACDMIVTTVIFNLYQGRALRATKITSMGELELTVIFVRTSIQILGR